MAHNALLAGGLLLLVVLVLSQLPPQALLHPGRHTQVITGVLGGLILVAVLHILGIYPLALDMLAYPSVTAFMGLYFGPLASGITAALALAGVFIVKPQIWPGVAAALAGALMLGELGRQARMRWPQQVWLPMIAIALLLPLVTQGSIQMVGFERKVSSLAEWLSQLHWYHSAGFLMLGAGRQLLAARAQSLLSLSSISNALHQRDHQLQLAMDAVVGGRWEWDVQARRLHCEGHLYESLGLHDLDSPDLWDRWYVRRHPDDVQNNAADLARAMNGELDTYSAEFRVLDTSGHWRWLMTRGRVVERDAQGRGLRLVGMDIDISERREVEDALRLSNAKYNSFFLTLPDPAGISRMVDGTYIDVNPAFCELFGRNREEIVGKTSVELGIWASDAERQELLLAFLRDGVVRQKPLMAYSHGRRIPGEMSARSVQIDGQACFVFIFHDLSSVQRTANALHATNQLLEQASSMARLGAWEENRETGETYWSDTCAEIHGLPKNIPAPANYIDTLVAPVYRDELRERIRQSLRTGIEWNMELQVIHADGHLLWVRARGKPVMENGILTRIHGVVQDIDETKQAEQLLRQSEERFARIFQLTPYPMGLTRQSDGSYVMVNTAWEEMIGIPMEEAIGKTALSLGIFTQEQRTRLLNAVGTNSQLMGHEITVQSRHAGQRTVLQSMRTVQLDDLPCWLFSTHDITERKREEVRVREREELLSLTLSAADLGLWDWDLQTGQMNGDKRWRAMRGLSTTGKTAPTPWQQDLSDSNAQDILAELHRHQEYPGTPFDATWSIATLQGSTRWLRSLGKIVQYDSDGHAQRMLGVSIDVTQQREQEVLLQQLAHYDALTGLPNRVLLARRLQEYMAQTSAHGTLLGIAYLDLDGFKPVNDRHGHGAGDRLLIAVARRLSDALRPRDCVARLGGDEFVVLMPDLHAPADCETLLQRLMDTIAAPYSLDSGRVVVTASIGYTLYPSNAADADTLLRHADQAMYMAKQAGRNRFHQFDEAHDRALQLHREQTKQLYSALSEDQFMLYLQPKVDMENGLVVGAEALARWQHPVRGVLPPAEFLPLLEGSDLEVTFGQWVIKEALRLTQELIDSGLHLPIGINISAYHLQHPGFVEWLTQHLADNPEVQPQQLEIEITESAALYDLSIAASALASLRQLGITISLDDFGTGYSSLTYLRRLPLDTLKIDQTFVHGMLADPSDLAIVQGVIGLSRSFGYHIIAEGVETEEQGQMLMQLGCTQVQGYCIARPMPSEQFIQWVRNWRPPASWQRQQSLFQSR